MSPAWTDSHCHLQPLGESGSGRVPPGDGPGGLAAVLERAARAGCRRMVCAGTDARTSEGAILLAEEHPGAREGEVEIYATVGLHPHQASEGLAEVEELLDRAREPGGGWSRVVAVGECGLDYHYDHSPRPVQREVFARQVELAARLGLALVVHTREAFEDTLAILQESPAPPRIVFHCFSGGPAVAESCLSTGAYLSFSGMVTFPGASDVREAARLCPLERLLVETDAPFLAPVPMRGRGNEPGYVPFVGEAIARERSLSVEEVAAATHANAASAFGIDSAAGGPRRPAGGREG